MSSIQNPSFDAAEFTAVPKTVATEFGARYPVAHAIRAKGAGTLTVLTAAGVSRVLNVNDGETVVIEFSEVTAMSGPTAYRIQVPKPRGLKDPYRG